jgi:putative lipoic acid-binding regulatory protein
VGHRRNKRENQRFLEVKEKENTNYKNLWDTPKAVLKGKFISMSVYIKRTERSQINNLMLHKKLLEKKKNKQNPKQAEGEK